MRALLHLLFQPGVGVLQPAGHIVELVGQRLEFVAGLDSDSLGQIAAADARGPRLQRLDRSDHAAGKNIPASTAKPSAAKSTKASRCNAA